MMEIGKSTEKAFYTFIELISDILGSVRVTKDTNKSAVGEHFTTLGTKIGEASTKLEEVAKKAETDGDKDGLLNKAIRAAVDTAKGVLGALKKHLEDLKDIGDASKK